MFKTAGLRKVIFYCGWCLFYPSHVHFLTRQGSSTGRGSRATGWLADHIANVEDADMKSLALLGGIKGWAAAGDEYVEWMDGFDAAVWAKSGPGC